MSAIIRDIDRPENSHKINYIRIVTEKGTVYDITKLFTDLIIYEGIRDDSVEGSLTFVDENDIMSTIPIIGREQLHISFTSRDDKGNFIEPPYEKVLSILSPDMLQRDKSVFRQIVTVNFVSSEFIKQSRIKVNRSFTASNSDIVTQLMTALESSVQVEECLHPRTVIAPNITPFDFIHMLADESTSKTNESCDFAFFENKDGYHFKSVYTLMQQEPVAVLNLDNRNVDDTYDRFTIHQYIVDRQFSSIDQLDGILGQTALTHDIINKNIIEHTATYYDLITKFKTMNGGSLFVDDTQEQFLNSSESFGLAEGPYKEHSANENNQRIVRDFNRTLLDSYVALAELPGNIDIKTGDVVDIDFKATDILDQHDYFRSGKHIVMKLKHALTPQTYMMTLELCKDSHKVIERQLS